MREQQLSNTLLLIQNTALCQRSLNLSTYLAVDGVVPISSVSSNLSRHKRVIVTTSRFHRVMHGDASISDRRQADAKAITDHVRIALRRVSWS